MERTSDTGSRKFSIKVESQELDRIIQARKNLDDVKALAMFAAQYKDLGWSPVALELPHGTDLGVDFDQPQAKCLWSLMDLALQEIRVGLSIRLEPELPLFVLRVKPALSRSLDRLGDWRSPCVARLGDAWEHHFLVLPDAWKLPPEQIIGDKEAPLSVIGPGQLVAVPPSLDPDLRAIWDWETPPWEQPPWEPSPELLILLEDCGLVSKKSQISVEELPSWKEIYPLISHSDKLLQALLAPEEMSDLYYRKILLEALQAGFQDLHLLLGLLWHAPHSELRLDPEGREQLSRWGEKLQGLLSTEATGLSRAAPEEMESSASPSSSEDLMSELQVLAAQTLELEQQLERLEDLGSGGDKGKEEGPPPSSLEPSSAPDEVHDDLRELEDLRRAVEDFLAGVKNLPESK